MREAGPVLKVKTSSDLVYCFACCVGVAIILGLITYWYSTKNYAFIAALFIVIGLRVTVNGTDDSVGDSPPPMPPPRVSSKEKRKNR